MNSGEVATMQRLEVLSQYRPKSADELIYSAVHASYYRNGKLSVLQLLSIRFQLDWKQ